MKTTLTILAAAALLAGCQNVSNRTLSTTAGGAIIGAGIGMMAGGDDKRNAAIGAVVGGLAGAGLVSWLGSAGIPATEDVLYFLFAGARLYPELHFDHLWPAFVIVVVVSLLSTFYPAIIATRISPRVALQERD